MRRLRQAFSSSNSAKYCGDCKAAVQRLQAAYARHKRAERGIKTPGYFYHIRDARITNDKLPHDARGQEWAARIQGVNSRISPYSRCKWAEAYLPNTLLIRTQYALFP